MLLVETHFNKVTKRFFQLYWNRAPIKVFSLEFSDQEVFCKKSVLKISIILPENTLAGVIFKIQLQVLGLQLH